MTAEQPGIITRLLQDIHNGNPKAKEQLGQLLLRELRNQAVHKMKKERKGHTWRPTDLVHEAVLRLLEDDVLARAPNRAYLFGAASKAMRRALVDHARRRRAERHGGDRKHAPLDEGLAYFESKGIDLLALDEALETLEALHSRQHQVVDEYYFGGFTMAEIADHLGVSEATVSKDYHRALLWLRTQMGEPK